MRRGSLLIPLLPLATVALSAGPLRAQERPPTPDEARALAPVVAAVRHVLDRFENEDWTRTADLFDGNPQVNDDAASPVPLEVNESFERTYRVREGSPRFERVLMPLIRQIGEARGPAVDKAGTQLRRLNKVTVDVYLNRTELDPGAPGDFREVRIPGAAKAFQLEVGHGDARGARYLLAFGRWNAARRTADEHVLRYDFVHPPHTPYVENVVVEVCGAQDRVEELLRTADWPSLNAALSR